MQIRAAFYKADDLQRVATLSALLIVSLPHCRYSNRNCNGRWLPSSRSARRCSAAAEAERLLKRCLEKNPQTPWAYLAQRELALMVNANPKDFELQLALGSAYEQGKQAEEQGVVFHAIDLNECPAAAFFEYAGGRLFFICLMLQAVHENVMFLRDAVRPSERFMAARKR